MNAIMSLREFAVKNLKMPIRNYAFHVLKDFCEDVMISTRHSSPKNFEV